MLKRFNLIINVIILLAIIGGLVVFLLKGPSIVGFYSAGDVVAFSQKLDITAEESQLYNITLEDVPPVPYKLTSAGLSGSIIGNGSVKVYLATEDGDRILMLDTDELKPKPAPITGFSTAEEPSADSADSGSSDTSSDSSSDTSSDTGGDTAEPESPSSETTTDTQGPGSPDTTVTPVDSGADTPPPPSGTPAPDEEPPPETPAEVPSEPSAEDNITEETIPENITALEENITEENITEGNITPEIAPEVPVGEEIIFEDFCVDTCYISDFLNGTSYILEVEIEQGTILKLNKISYTIEILTPEVLPANITNITELNITNETVFFATNIKDAGNNTVTAVIEFVNPETEELEAIGKSEDGDRDITTRDLEKTKKSKEREAEEQPTGPAINETSDNRTLAETSPTQEQPPVQPVEPIIPESAPLFQAAAVLPVPDTPTATIPVNEQGVIEEQPGEPGLEIPKGQYKIKVKPQNHPVEEIVFENLVLENSSIEFIRLDDVPESENDSFVEVYAVDPTGFAFTSASVTVTAKGNALMKCKEWDFANQTCLGAWTQIQSLVPGQPYTFTLTPEDPGYGEINITKALHLDSNRTVISDIYDSVKTLDNLWSEPIPDGDYVRVTFEQNLTSENDITVYPRSVNGTAPRIEVYEVDGTELIAEFTSLTDNSYNKVYLASLQGSQDTFDLLIKNGILEFDHIVDPATGNTSTTLAFFLNDMFGGGDKGNDGGDFDENPIQMNDYGQATEKCGLWDCTVWSTTSSSKNAYCSGSWNCTSWNGITCGEYKCLGWSESPNSRARTYCSGEWDCTSWNGGVCGTWNCTAWTTGVSDTDYYCSGNWNCTAWNGNACDKWSCNSWSNVGGKLDRHCSGVWDCTSWNGNVCGNWNCTTWSSGETANKDYYPSDGWNCTAWNGDSCDNWQGLTWTLAASAERDQYCDRWNCTTWDSNKKVCQKWDCLEWLMGTSNDLDYYCSGVYSCTAWQNFSYDNTPPQWSNPQRNVSVVYKNDFVKFNTSWTDNAGLSAYIFSTNNTGTWVNQSAVVFTGTSNTSNQNHNITANRNVVVGWRFFANDTSNNWNSTSIQAFTVGDKVPTSVTLNSPVNAYNESSTNPITFNCSATDDYALSNITLFGNFSGSWASNGTNTVTGTSNTTTFSRTLANGYYVWNCRATDDASQTTFATANRTLTVDTVPPAITFVSPTPANNTQTTNTFVFVNVTVVDAQSSIGSCWLNFNSVNSTMTKVGSGTSVSCNLNKTSIADGSYNYNVYSNDSLGNVNVSETRTISIDTTKPQIQFVSPTPANNTILSGQKKINVTATDTNFANITVYKDAVEVLTCASSPCLYAWDTVGDLDGTYKINATARDTVGNQNSTETRTYTVSNLGPTINYVVPTPDNGSVQSSTSATINATAAGNFDITSCTLLFDGVNETMTKIGSGTDVVCIKAKSSLSAGSHTFRVYATNVENQTTAAGVQTFSIDTAPPQYSNLIESPTDPATYSPSQTYMFNSTWTDGTAIDKVILEFNGVNYSANNSGTEFYYSLSNLAAGVHNYTWYANDTLGNSNSTGTLTYTVSAAADTVNLYLNGNQSNLTITYSTESNASASSISGTHSLFRDSVPVGNPEIATLAAGTYQYKANSTGNANYSAGSDAIYYLVINKAASSVNLLLNGADSNITVNQSQQVNITGQLLAGESILELYQDGTLINSGASPLTNLTSYPTVGVRNITVVYPQSQNYSSSSETHFVNVIDSTAPAVTAISPPDGYFNGPEEYFEYNVTDLDSGIAKCELIINGAVDQNSTNITEGMTQSFFKEFTASGNYTWRIDCTDDSANSNKGSSETRNLTVVTQGVNVFDVAGQNTGRGTNATYTIVVRNTGTAIDNYTLSLNNLDNADIAVLNQTTLIDVPAKSNVSVIANVTDNDSVGVFRVNLTATSDSNSEISDSIEIATTVLGNLSTALLSPNGSPAPVYYQGQNIPFKAHVKDELNNNITSAVVTFEPINGSSAYICASVADEGNGYYNCTLNTAAMPVPTYYNVRTNATKQFYNPATLTNNTVFYLGYDTSANLTLSKLPNVQSINASHVVYNVTLDLKTTKGVSDSTQLNDIDGNISNSEGTINTTGVKRYYLLTYARGAQDQTITLAKANASGYDPLYERSLFAESNAPVILVPENDSAVQLIIVKNLVYLDQATTNITYTITDQVINSGDQDLIGVSIVDSDIGLTNISDIAEGSSVSFSGNKTIQKSAQSFVHNFTQATASVNGTFFYSNVPSVVIPGYGGPYDVVIKSLPGSVTTGSLITGLVEVINQNTEISEDRTLTTWIEDSSGGVLDIDVRTIFVGRGESATFSVTLTAPSSVGSYFYKSELVWPTATANASKTFSVTAPPAAPATGIGGLKEPKTNETGENLTVVEELPPVEFAAGMPYDIKADLIALRTSYNKEASELNSLRECIRNVEDAAARGEWDKARNWIINCQGLLADYKPVGFEAFTSGFSLELQSVKLRHLAPAVFLILIVILLSTQIHKVIRLKRRKEEKDMRHYLDFLRYERKTLERLDKLVDKKTKELNRKLDNIRRRDINP